jgi:hypothetical protein
MPESFNRPTPAHMPLAISALAGVGEVVVVLPRNFPHNAFKGSSRLRKKAARMIQALTVVARQVAANT